MGRIIDGLGTNQKVARTSRRLAWPGPPPICGRVRMERGAAHETTGLSHETPSTSESAEAMSESPRGLEFQRFFTLPGVDPFDEVTWEQRSAVIGNERGEGVLEQRGVEIPLLWR